MDEMSLAFAKIRMLIVACLFSVPVLSWADVLELPKLDRAVVTVAVSKHPSTPDVFIYEMRVSNASSSELPINGLTLDLGNEPHRVALQGEGLRNTAEKIPPSTEAYRNIFGPEQAVPIGLVSAPDRWLSGINSDGHVRWGALKEDAMIASGLAGGPFVYEARGIPGLRTVKVTPDLWEHLPSIDELIEAGKSMDDLRAAKDSSSAFVSTLGPVAPPKEIDVSTLCEEILESLTRAEGLGWVREPGVANSLRKKIENMKSALTRGQAKAAASIGRALLNEIDGASCKEASCPGNKPISSEGYALLYFNVEFLLENL